MARPKSLKPSYCHHKASGRAFCTLDGCRVYLGTYGTPASRDAYDRAIGEWIARGRRAEPPPQPGAGGADGIKVTELIDAFWTHASGYYVADDGTQGRELENFRGALRLLKRLYGPTPAAAFGPKALKVVRQAMIDAKWTRRYINRQIGRLRHVFKFGVESEIVPAAVHQALTAVDGLKRGKGGAVEADPVTPVPEEFVFAIRPHVSRQVWAMAELQLETGMRSGEVTGMRPVDINTSETPWVYSPPKHKTAHHNHARNVYLGQRAREILEPFLAGRPFESFIFSPAEAEAERRAALHARRKTPMSCGNRPGTNKRRKPVRTVGNRYTVNAYLQAIYKACDKAFPPTAPLAKAKGETAAQWRARLTPEQRVELKAWREEHRWHPHQLRHNFATKMRRLHGIEVARILLGHSSPAITALYAEADRQKAVQAMRDVG